MTLNLSGNVARGNFRISQLAASRHEWVRLALATADDHESKDTRFITHRERTPNDDLSDFFGWVALMSIVVLFFALGKCIQRHPHGGEHDGVGNPSVRRAEVASVLNSLNQWAPARQFSEISSDRDALRSLGINPFENLDKGGLEMQLGCGCSICFEEFSPSSSVRLLPCCHIFHKDCLDTWFSRSALCPLCMHNYVTGPPPTRVQRRISINSNQQQDPNLPNEHFSGGSSIELMPLGTNVSELRSNQVDYNDGSSTEQTNENSIGGFVSTSGIRRFWRQFTSGRQQRSPDYENSFV